jgi:hypothetical protein
MTDERDAKREEKREDLPAEEPPPEDEVEDSALSALLKRSLAAEPDGAEAAPDDDALLRGVQRKLRIRSKGKFYADGWSTTQSRLNYALVAAVMLVTILAVYLALGPTGISAP